MGHVSGRMQGIRTETELYRALDPLPTFGSRIGVVANVGIELGVVIRRKGKIQPPLHWKWNKPTKAGVSLELVYRHSFQCMHMAASGIRLFHGLCDDGSGIGLEPHLFREPIILLDVQLAPIAVEECSLIDLPQEMGFFPLEGEHKRTLHKSMREVRISGEITIAVYVVRPQGHAHELA